MQPLTDWIHARSIRYKSASLLCCCPTALQGNTQAVASAIAQASESGQGSAQAQAISQAFAQGGGTAQAVSQAVAQAYTTGGDKGAVANTLAQAITSANSAGEDFLGHLCTGVCFNAEMVLLPQNPYQDPSRLHNWWGLCHWSTF